MEQHQIRDRDVLEKAMSAEQFLLLKHSRKCPFSAKAFTEYGAFVSEHPDVDHGWIDVVGQRDWSQWVAERSGVVHESPQALLIRNGQVAWKASHFAITRTSMEKALGG